MKIKSGQASNKKLSEIITQDQTECKKMKKKKHQCQNKSSLVD